MQAQHPLVPEITAGHSYSRHSPCAACGDLNGCRRAMPESAAASCTLRLHLGRDSYQGDTSHWFGVNPTGRKVCTLPDWFVLRLFGRLLRPGEVQPVDVTIKTHGQHSLSPTVPCPACADPDGCQRL